MTDVLPPDLTLAQIATLEKLLRAGFKFVTLERVERFLGVEKDCFVALLDPSGVKLKIYGQVGYRLEQGVAMLVERREGKAFVWKNQSVTATPELVAAYEGFKSELKGLLEEEESPAG